MPKRNQPIGYDYAHKWMKKHYGKANHCENCLENPKSLKFEWSNISGLYIRECSDWQQLCKVCHTVFDAPEKNISMHGMASYYINKKCRCQLCRDAHTIYIKAYRKRVGITPKYYKRFRLVDGNLIRKER